MLRGAARASKLSGAPLSVHLPGWERHAHRVLDVVESEGADLLPFRADEVPTTTEAPSSNTI